SYWQILLSVSFNPNKKAEEYALFLGVTKSKIYKVVELYNKNSADFTSTLNWGGRRATIYPHLVLNFQKNKER
ncbi:MAG: hypothetical protein JSU07_09235, partial [Bacteroidetes bacterium]|nr:hypothetical protein [Bacteroidota bacterium]